MPPVVDAIDAHIDAFEAKINEIDARMLLLLSQENDRKSMSASALQRRRYKTNGAFKRLQTEMQAARATLQALQAAKRDVIHALLAPVA